MCRTCMPTSTSTRNCWKKSQANQFRFVSASRSHGRLSFCLADGPRIHRSEVFNIFVENTVEKDSCAGVSDSSRDASTHCTGESAGTFVVQPASRIGTSPRFLVLSFEFGPSLE